jgi:exodeoxyribonuclease VII large subunit
MMRTGPALLDRARSAVSVGAARLEDLSPLAILGRGYAVCFAVDGRTVVKSVADVAAGESLSVRVRDGRIAAAVTDLMPLEGQ